MTGDARTIGEWLRSREPAPPPALLERAMAALGAATQTSASLVGDACLDAAIALLEPLLGHPDAGRECALDLLTADALATYAFEAAAESPVELETRARRAVARIAALGVPTGSEPIHPTVE